MAKLWGDAKFEEAVKRMSDLGVREIAVKNGPEAGGSLRSSQILLTSGRGHVASAPSAVASSRHEFLTSSV